MDQYPKGKIHIVKRKDRVQYYLRMESGDKSGKYISKKDTDVVRTYLCKRYDEGVYRIVKHEMRILEMILEKGELFTTDLQKLYSDNPSEVKAYLHPFDVSDSDYEREWLNEPFEGKEIGKDVPVFISNKGDRVRSKSELNIANMLFANNIPYKYECPFRLSNGQIIYPDFTVLIVKKRKTVYWEHRGMMDDREYARHAVSRVKQLEKEGLMQGDRLIITEETQNCPLGTDEIEKIIDTYFLV